MPVDGLLIVDKPVGPTSHDVVARVRRVLREPRIGHTGTLDPLASGVLLLMIGRATRLAQFMTTDAKRYQATIRLGFSTDTCDALGRPTTSLYAGAFPSRERIEEALDAFRGTFLQQPPAFSAKKIDGHRSYKLARRNRRASSQPARPAPSDPPAPTAMPALTSVTVTSLEVIDVAHDLVRIDVACSSGFYVRALAHDLGVALETGGHLAALRRTEAGGWTIGDAVALSAIDNPVDGLMRAQEALIPLVDVLPEMPRLTLTADGVRRAASGCDIGPRDLLHGLPDAWPARVRLLNESTELVGIANLTAAGLLHPVVVLM
jgi:tRNA pseudouridine55 synthase